MENLSVDQVANGILVILLGLLSYLGIKGGVARGKSQAGPDETTVEFSGAIVSGASIKELSKAIGDARMTFAMMHDETTKVDRDRIDAMKRICDAVEALALHVKVQNEMSARREEKREKDELDDLRRENADLRREVSRQPTSPMRKD